MTTPAPEFPTDRETVRQALRARRAWPSLGAGNAPSFARALRQRSLLIAPEAPLYRRRAACWINSGR